jgi:arylsulfatase A-like enzyme
MTGQYSIRNGLSLASIPGTPNTLSASAYTMGQLFRDAVYTTAIFRKCVTERLGLRLQRERFQRFGVGFNAQVCTFNVRNLLALGI